MKENVEFIIYKFYIIMFFNFFLQFNMEKQSNSKITLENWIF